MPCDRCFAVLAALQTPEDAQDVVIACVDAHLQPGMSTISNTSQLLPFQGPALAALHTEGAPKDAVHLASCQQQADAICFWHFSRCRCCLCCSRRNQKRPAHALWPPSC